MVTDASSSRDFPALRTLAGTWECPSHASSGVSCSYVISRADGGRSIGDFAAGNLADHVGDDQDAVQTNRRHLASALKAKEGLAFIRASHGADAVSYTHLTLPTIYSV